MPRAVRVVYYLAAAVAACLLGTTLAVAPTYGYHYDVATIARVEAHEFDDAPAGTARLDEVGRGLVSPSVEARGATTNPRPGSVATEAGTPQVLVNQANGNAARDAIASQYPGARMEVSLQTDLGWRRIDVLTDQGLAIESKVGYTSLTSSTRSQIAKDAALLSDPASGVSAVQWRFATSPVTGVGGPSGPLADALTKAGISWVAP